MTAVDIHPLVALPQPRTVQETGLNPDLLVQLLLKTLYYGGAAGVGSGEA
jgi:hypothetical protein